MPQAGDIVDGAAMHAHQETFMRSGSVPPA